jgi:protein-disulfide isomerase/uncharacterized membrane protein
MVRAGLEIVMSLQSARTLPSGSSALVASSAKSRGGSNAPGSAARPRVNGVAAKIGGSEAEGNGAKVIRLPRWAYFVGLLAILVAVFGSGALVAKHLFKLSLPGCGAGAVRGAGGDGMSFAAPTVESACAALEAHPMGSVGGMWKFISTGGHADKITELEAWWPTSFLGLTYFLAALAAWVVMGARSRRVHGAVPWIARFGALASLAFLGIIFATWHLCPYCITAHAGNLALLITLEIGMMKARGLSLGGVFDRSWMPVVAALAIFGVSSGILGAAEINRVEKLKDADREAAEESARKLGAQMKAQAAAAAEAAKEEKKPWGADGCRGRWLLGPKQTPIRVVMLTDFQCPDCRMFEGMAMQSLEKYKDKMSLSIVHFPMCTPCNPHVSKTMHDNACRAACAAEAAAIVAGSKAENDGQERWPAANDMFWKVAKWLFEVKGDFTDESMKAKLPSFGITDTEQFMKIMNGPGTLKLVQNDAEWGEALGLYYTPMMFVNGVEVRGWLTRPAVLTDMIDAAAAANGPAADARGDQPPLAATKFFEDWQKSPVMDIPAPAADHVKTSTVAGEKVNVVVFGDFNEPNCKKVDDMIKAWLATKPISYSWRHFPFDNTCNPAVPKAMFPSGCVAAKGVEAAAVVGGAEAYWNMHDLLFQKGANLTPNVIAMAAGVVGLDQAKYDAAATSGPVGVLVQNDTLLGARMGFRAIPAIYVNGKLVERWSRGENDNVLERVIDYAAKHPEENVKPAGK